VARHGGDEFTILLEDITALREAIRVAERIAHALRTPFVLDGHQISITASIGIALNSPGHETPADLLRNADAAMYKAKRAGKARYEVFEPDSPPALDEIDAGESEVSIRRTPIWGEPSGSDEEGPGSSPLSDRA
jgi:predicted signal transduction protein with EAL and GGDEF domain